MSRRELEDRARRYREMADWIAYPEMRRAYRSMAAQVEREIEKTAADPQPVTKTHSSLGVTRRELQQMIDQAISKALGAAKAQTEAVTGELKAVLHKAHTASPAGRSSATIAKRHRAEADRLRGMADQTSGDLAKGYLLRAKAEDQAAEQAELKEIRS